MKDIPNPGTAEAVEAGCTCPVMDNHYGHGVPFGKGVQFWYTEGCPVHTNKEESKDD